MVKSTLDLQNISMHYLDALLTANLSLRRKQVQIKCTVSLCTISNAPSRLKIAADFFRSWQGTKKEISIIHYKYGLTKFTNLNKVTIIIRNFTQKRLR